MHILKKIAINHTNTLPLVLAISFCFLINGSINGQSVKGKKSSKPLNIVYILSDDHRYDFMGFTGKVPFLKTPNMDKMALQGAHMKNAFVSTALCSPSRASILIGQFTHRHGVVDNQSPVPDSAVFFPEYLQKAGYETAFLGKWHMGEHHDDPRKGFDHWVSFKGQGVYYNPSLNVNGKRVNYTDSSYITDLLTAYALDWLDERDTKKPFFLYLSHKAVHSEFYPARRHQNQYENADISYPATMYPPEDEQKGRRPKSGFQYNYADVPNWVKEQRHSWHGVDYMYHGAISFEDFYKQYCETLLGVDESIGKVLEYLQKNDLLESTIVMYMGDNGFSFGEHGLIDKRHAYEESMRVPLLVYSPAHIQPGTVVEEMVQNIDIAPTILDYAGLKTPADMDGKSFAPLLKGKEIPWRTQVFYEYFWERPFPQTPTMHAIRTDSLKYIRYYGLWDINELYNLVEDPFEANNLIRDPAYKDASEKLNRALFDWLESTNGMAIPLKRDHGARFDNKYNKTY